METIKYCSFDFIHMQLPNKVIIKQKAELIEVLSGFETKNKYIIYDEGGNELFYAYEESNFFLNQFMGSWRPLKLHIISSDKKHEMQIERPFYFLFPKHKIYGSDGQLIGKINRRFKWLDRFFDIFNESGLLFGCLSKHIHFWTYDVLSNGQKVGQILKKWSGVGKEMFTDADNFMVDFGTVSDEKSKMLILATAFAIDLNIFEHKKKNIFLRNKRRDTSNFRFTRPGTL